MAEPVAEYITRAEYEARHAELKIEFLNLSSDVKSNQKEIQAKLEVLSEKLDTARVSSWKLIAVSALNFIMGGGLVAVLSYFHFPH